MSKFKDNETAKTAELNTIIGKGSEVKGDLIVQHSMRVDGTVKGTIEANGFLVVGKEGTVEGEITVGNIVVGGTVKGNINASGKVLLETRSTFKGDMRTSKLVIEEGAVFEGKCSMAETSIDIPKKENNMKKWEKPKDQPETTENQKLL